MKRGLPRRGRHAFHPFLLASIGFWCSPVPMAALLVWNLHLLGVEHDRVLRGAGIALGVAVVHTGVVLALPEANIGYVVALGINLACVPVAIALQDKPYRDFVRQGGGPASRMVAILTAIGVLVLQGLFAFALAFVGLMLGVLPG